MPKPQSDVAGATYEVAGPPRPNGLITPLGQVRRRLSAIGLDASADTFLTTSYVAEAAVKLLALTLRSGLEELAPEAAYRIGYDLVRADGLGTWAQAIRQMVAQPLSGYIPPDLRPLVAWITKKRKGELWFAPAIGGLEVVFRALGEDPGSRTQDQTVAGLIVALVQIRNRTKGHGALGPDFFRGTNHAYSAAVAGLIDHCPAFDWSWWAVYPRPSIGAPHVVNLNGPDPTAIPSPEAERFATLPHGIYFSPEHSQRVYSVGSLLRTNRECSLFRLPNGGYRDGGEASFIDYFLGGETRESVDAFSSPPAKLPASETHGLLALEVQSNVFGNLPPIPRGYVERPALQSELESRIRDRNHAIITLHGRGGVGKTSLALYLAHQLAAETDPQFEQIVWFSARDIDLRPSGPRPVRAAVVTLQDVSETYSMLFGTESTESAFAEVLQKPARQSKGALLIFDNFETMENTRDLHRFLDIHTHLPNKVLITSRERAFKADYPIEIRGMEFDEAATMLRSSARELGVASIVSDNVIEKIYDYTEGHAYLMRVILGEIAKKGQFVPPRSIVSQRIDIVSAVFERSFNQLSADARRVFLAIANWNSAVSELALIVVLGQQNISVERALEELKRLSMVSEDAMADGHPCFFAPQLARVFGQTKLVGDPDRPLIAEDLEAVRSFGVVEIGRATKHDQASQIERFFDWCFRQAENADAARIQRLDEMLVLVANLWPPAWLRVSEFRQSFAPSEGRRASVDYSLRRAVEEMPFNKEAWLRRAKFAEYNGDPSVRITSLISAVEADPSDVSLLSDTARALITYIRDHDVPTTRRGSYLASVRGHMERAATSLDPDDLSKLAWLFLLEGDRDNAQKYAALGLRKDKHNAHCRSILDRIQRDTGKIIPGPRY
jgi:hypothetical protein